MADVKISGLPASTVPLAGTEVLPIVQGGATKQVSIANVTAGRDVTALSVTSTSITDSALTSGRVTYAGTAGLLQDDADFTFNGTTVTMANDASISGLTVGKGGGAVATNTAVGSNCLAANSSGAGYNASFGLNALGSFNTTGNTNNSAFGASSLASVVTGTDNTGIGAGAGSSATGSFNTAVGSKSFSYTPGGSGSYNTSVGALALYSNTTASYNTAVGYQAGYSNTVGTGNTFFGYGAGYGSNHTADANAFNMAIGHQAGYSLTTGSNNTFVGQGQNGFGAGFYVTTGSKNTIIGSYNGNQGGLDIRTLSNYLVLSDGDGNPRIYHNGTTVVIPNLPTSSAGLPTGGLYVLAGALMVA